MFKPPKPNENLGYLIQELEELESLASSSINFEKPKSTLFSEDIFNPIFLFRLIRNQAILLRIQMIQSNLWKETEFLKRLAFVIEKLNKNIKYLS
ncbi:MAG: hypothetical protein ACFE95_15690 [Candidatus Hodarchaeota archaeon]